MTTFSRTLSALVVVFGLGGLAACEQDGAMEDAGESADEAVDEGMDTMEETGETVEESMDTPGGDEMPAEEEQ